MVLSYETGKLKMKMQIMLKKIGFKGSFYRLGVWLRGSILA